MAKTIILKLKAQMQFWPPNDDYSVAKTCRLPTKRGVLRHIVAAAQGRAPDADISDLEKAIRFGTAACRTGEAVYWFGDDSLAVETEKEGLEDYVFYVALTCEDSLALEIASQIQEPAEELTLGYERDDFLPDEPLVQSITDEPLLKALLDAVKADPLRRIRVEIEEEDNDPPIDFSKTV